MSPRSASDYFPTIIDSRPLLPRLASELNSFKQECKLAWTEFKQHPLQAAVRIAAVTLNRVRHILLAPNVLAAVLVVSAVIVGIFVFERAFRWTAIEKDLSDETSPSTINILELNQPNKKNDAGGIGRNGSGQVGCQKGRGEGSGEVQQRARGGGSGGNHDPLPPQVGKLPPPSNILASIPTVPQVHPPSLPVAGTDVDPALWKDLKAPVYGDPRSTSTATSKGPGDGGGIGNNNGLDVGDGHGPGFGPGNNGNMGGDDKQTGCCGGSGANGNHPSMEQRIFRGNEVEQRARLLLKPEPQYTEEARRNQITGTVMLRVVFSSTGQVEQIRAVQTLPFGLTERAIAAARQIKFVPATTGGRPISVYMQLEYNFNLY